MSQPFDTFTQEAAYQRKVLLALEVLDAVTLQRVSQGLTVTASGLRGGPLVNASGIFVWLEEVPAALQMIAIEPGRLPFEAARLPAAQIRQPFTSVELAPTCSYPFAAGMTGLCGSLVEKRGAAPGNLQPIAGAQVRLVWLADDGATWNDAPTRSHTSANGDFAVILRFAPTDVPQLDANGNLTVRLRVDRGTGRELGTGNFSIRQGLVADAQTYLRQGGAPHDLVVAWNELQP